MTLRTIAITLLGLGLLLPAGCRSGKRAEVVTLLDAGAAPGAAGWHEQSMDVAGVQRWFRYFVPSNAPANPPVVFLLHGGKMSMRKIFERGIGGARGWLTLADREGVILVTPNGTNPKTGDTRGDEDQMWNDIRPANASRRSTNDDVMFFGRLLDWTVATLHADAHRAYVTGASNGGMMTYRLAVEIPERFAAAAAFIATLPADISLAKQPAHPIPMMIANGTKDPIMKWKGGHGPEGLNQSSTPDTLAWWIEADHANPDGAKTEALPDTDPNDHCRIYRTLYPALDGGAPVLFFKVEGGSHAAPSLEHWYHEGPIIQTVMGLPRDAEGAELAWEFMKQFTR